MKKVMNLLCVLTVGAVFAAFTPQPDVSETELNNLEVLTKFETTNKTVKRFSGNMKLLCTGGTGHDTWGVAIIDGVYYAIPSQNQQAEGNLPKVISGAMANMMCAMQ